MYISVVANSGSKGQRKIIWSGKITNIIMCSLRDMVKLQQVEDSWMTRGCGRVCSAECITKGSRCIQCESKNPPPPIGPDIFSFFHKRLRICSRFFTYLLIVPIFARLQIFIQLSLILTKLCYIKCDYPVHIICAKCPKTRHNARVQTFA